MANFVVVVTTPDDPDLIEYFGPFSSADGSGDSKHDAWTWMNQRIWGKSVTARAIEMFEP